MTREEAKRTLQDMWECLFNEMTNHTFEDLKEHGMLDNYSTAFDMAISALSVPERKKGEWVEREVKSREGTYLECSRCGCLPPTLECADRIIFIRSNFCPDCGADMRT